MTGTFHGDPRIGWLVARGLPFVSFGRPWGSDASDSLAIGAHLAAVAAGLPALPIVGFDNTPAAEALGLSSVEQLPERVAAGALDLLMGPTGSVVSPQPAAAGSAHVLVEPRLVLR